MVEMTEMANILHNATASSLVLMDEIGCGTSTFDGLSLAWSTAVFVAEKLQAFTLFATHYFELNWLTVCPTSVCTPRRREHDSGILFPHSVKAGPGQSKLWSASCTTGGDPDNGHSICSSETCELERNDSIRSVIQSRPERNPTAANRTFRTQTHPVWIFEKINPDEISAKEALAILYDLKKRLSQ